MVKKKTSPQDGFNEILLYTTPNGNVRLQVFLRNETIWLTQQKIADLFRVQRPAITKHLKNIFESGELKEKSVSSILELTAADGKSYKTQFYYSQCSADYDVNAQITREFFSYVQNKLHWAITGQTAAEIIASRADSTKQNMGLTN